MAKDPRYARPHLTPEHQSLTAQASMRKQKERERLFPRRQNLLLYWALDKLGWEYEREWEFYNPYSTGARGNKHGLPAWIDALITLNGKQWAVDLRDPVSNSRMHRMHVEKRAGLTELGIHYTVIEEVTTSSDIMAWLLRERRRNNL